MIEVMCLIFSRQEKNMPSKIKIFTFSGSSSRVILWAHNSYEHIICMTSSIASNKPSEVLLASANIPVFYITFPYHSHRQVDSEVPIIENVPKYGSHFRSLWHPGQSIHFYPLKPVLKFFTRGFKIMNIGVVCIIICKCILLLLCDVGYLQINITFLIDVPTLCLSIILISGIHCRLS